MRGDGLAEIRVPLSVPPGVKNFGPPNTALVMVQDNDWDKVSWGKWLNNQSITLSKIKR